MSHKTLTDTERADRASAVLRIIRQLDDEASIDEIAVVSRIMHRFDRLRVSGARTADVQRCALDEALQIELTDLRFDRERTAEHREVARDAMPIAVDRHVSSRAAVLPGYQALAAVLDEALGQAQLSKGMERHAGAGERFEDQQIVQLGEWMASPAFAIGQACKKSLESTRLPHDRSRAELLGAINYLAAAVIVGDRAATKKAG